MGASPNFRAVLESRRHQRHDGQGMANRMNGETLFTVFGYALVFVLLYFMNYAQEPGGKRAIASKLGRLFRRLDLDEPASRLERYVERTSTTLETAQETTADRVSRLNDALVDAVRLMSEIHEQVNKGQRDAARLQQELATYQAAAQLSQ